MATFITGAIVAVGLYYALRHVYRNFRMGREDCCGGNCSACSGHCMGGMPPCRRRVYDAPALIHS